MILKEIQMDLPFIKSDEIISDESIKIYESTWKRKRREFQLMSRCMTSMIERLMPVIDSDKYWKILIECVDGATRIKCVDMLGVCSVQVPFDINSFYQMSNYKKKEYIIKKVEEAIDKMTEYGLSEFDKIKHTCEDIKGLNYRNEWFWKKPVKHNQKSAQVKILHEVDKVSIYMVIKDDRNNMTKESLLVEDIPDEWVYSKYLGKLEWVSEDTTQLVTKNGETFIVNL